ncbi:hypothetical protein JCM8097_003082 [Rhodosporidiobolus ruineniae]
MTDIRVLDSPAAFPTQQPAVFAQTTSPSMLSSASATGEGQSLSPQQGVVNLAASTSSAAGGSLGGGEGAASSRPFRSKKVRPCDGCRKRKNRCAIPIEGDPCVECKQTGRQCTFLLPPPVRPKKEPAPSAPPPPAAPLFPSTFSAELAAPPVQPAPFSTPPVAPAPVLPTPGTFAFTVPPNKRPLLASDDQLPRKRSTPSSTPGGGLVSLDRDLPGGVEPCAVTATLTDDLLTHRTVGSSRQISSDRNRSQFILFHALPPHRRTDDEYQHQALRQLRSFLAFAVPEISEEALLQHHLSHLHPSLPILPLGPSHSVESFPPGLRALLLVSSLSYFPGQRRTAAHAWSLVKQEKLADKMLETPRLSSLSAALLELDTNLDPRNDFALLAKTIAHAQLLGLHVDCRAWAIPDWEKSLRERIWWSLRMHDAWASFLNSRPSHIQLGNTNVPLPPFPTPDDPVESYNGGISFAYSCRLAVIVSRLQTEVSTLDKYGTDRAPACDYLEKELNSMKEGARPFLEMSRRPVGMDAFLFSLLALRCMVRRISIEIRIGLGNSFLPDGNSLDIFADLVKYVASLNEDSFAGNQWWICYSSHILSSVLSSLIRLSLAAISAKHNSPPSTAGSSAQPASQPSTPSPAVHLLAQLCISLDTAYSTHGWSVAEAALGRAASVAERLEAVTQADGGGEDYLEVILALRREPFPAVAMPTAGAAVETGPLDGLHALASLAGGSGNGGEGLEGGEVETAGGAAAGAVAWPLSHASSGEGLGDLGALTFESFGMPELDEWLNVLDEAPRWGGEDGSPSNWGISW